MSLGHELPESKTPQRVVKGSTKEGIPIGEFLLMVDVCSLGTIDFLYIV